MSEVVETIKVGDRFYHNNICVQRKLSFPDYMVVKEISNDILTVAFECRSIGTKEVTMSMTDVLAHSNRNPSCEKPTWIFVDG